MLPQNGDRNGPQNNILVLSSGHYGLRGFSNESRRVDYLWNIDGYVLVFLARAL